MKPMVELRITIAPIANASNESPNINEMTAAIIRIITKTFLNCAKNLKMIGGLGLIGSELGPTFLRRDSISRVVRPLVGLVLNSLMTSSADCW